MKIISKLCFVPGIELLRFIPRLIAMSGCSFNPNLPFSVSGKMDFVILGSCLSNLERSALFFKRTYLIK